ncbi:MAG: aminotransferase class I/II-fold pyridoxal phosphate-dependent enzyme [Bacteroidales bacterium]|jgi:O-acetylhomoserine (thiol)-lyase
MKLATKAIHTPFNKKDIHGSLRMPVYDNAAFETENAETMENAFKGTQAIHVYSRLSNPTVEYFESVVKNLTDSSGVIALSSGMAAISNVFFGLSQTGDNFISSNKLFGNTYSLFENTLKPFGISFKYADVKNVENIEKLIDSNTRGIFLETVTNPQNEIADLKKISAIAKKHNLLLIVDSTATPICFFKAKELGVDIEVISSTKYISGGATSVGGIIIDHGSFNWSHIPKLSADNKKFGKFTFIAKLRKEVFRNIGACLSPHNAFLQTLGLETFILRVEKSCYNAQLLAEWLQKQKLITKINYSGLSNSEFHEIGNQQFGSLHGGIISFEMLKKEYCFEFLNNLKIIRRATNLNDNKTLAIHPASTIYSEYSNEIKKELNITETLIRISLGIEDIEDIIEDIKYSLENLKS